MTALHHIGYYVDDLEEAVHRAIRDLGIGPFLHHENITFDEFTCADGIAGVEPVAFDHSAAFAAWGAMVLELAEVHESNFAIDGMRAGLAGLAADWDGVTDPIRPMRPPHDQPR